MLQGLDRAIALGTEGRMKNGRVCLLALDSKTTCMLATLWHFPSENRRPNGKQSIIIGGLHCQAL